MKLRRTLKLCSHYVYYAVGVNAVCWLQRDTLLDGWIKCYKKRYRNSYDRIPFFETYKYYVVYAYVKHLLEQHSDEEILQLTLHTREELEKYVEFVEKRYHLLT